MCLGWASLALQKLELLERRVRQPHSLSSTPRTCGQELICVESQFGADKEVAYGQVKEERKISSGGDTVCFLVLIS